MPFARILVAIDGSRGSLKALDVAVELARLTDGELLALAVEGPLPAYAATVGEVEEVKREKDAFFGAVGAKARDEADRAGVELEVELRPGHPAEQITRYGRERDVDLIVVGQSGHSLRGHLLGSTADRVAHQAHCPVLIVK